MGRGATTKSGSILLALFQLTPDEFSNVSELLVVVKPSYVGSLGLTILGAFFHGIVVRWHVITLSIHFLKP